jgi:hypothetical protein
MDSSGWVKRFELFERLERLERFHALLAEAYPPAARAAFATEMIDKVKRVD